MSKIQRMTFGIVAVLIGCAVSAFSQPPEICNDTLLSAKEQLREAKKEFDAGRFDESLKIVIDTHPKEGARNVRQYPVNARYTAIQVKSDRDISNLVVSVENEFYQKDLLLTKLAEVFLTNTQYLLVLEAAKNIGQDKIRNLWFRDIASKYLADSMSSSVPNINTPDDIHAYHEEMFDKAIQTALLIEDKYKSRFLFESIVRHAGEKGKFSLAAEMAANIQDSQHHGSLYRNRALVDLVRQNRKNLQEPDIKTILERIDDPKYRCKALSCWIFNLPNNSDPIPIVAQSPDKCREYLTVVLDTFNAIEKPGLDNDGMNDFHLLINMGRLCYSLEMYEDAEKVWDFILQALDRNPGYKFSIGLDLIWSFNGIISRDIQAQKPIPAKVLERLDQQVRQQHEVLREAPRWDYWNAVFRNGNHMSKDLYEEIFESLSFLVSKHELTEGEKIGLLPTYFSRSLRADSDEERFNGLKKWFVPLLLDIYSNSKPGQEGEKARKQCCSFLANIFSVFSKSDKFDELLSLPGIPQELSQDALVEAASRKLSRSKPFSRAEIVEIEDTFLHRIKNDEKRTQLQNMMSGTFRDR